MINYFELYSVNCITTISILRNQNQAYLFGAHQQINSKNIVSQLGALIGFVIIIIIGLMYVFLC